MKGLFLRSRANLRCIQVVVWLTVVCCVCLAQVWAQVGDGMNRPKFLPQQALAGGVFEIDGNLFSGIPADVGKDWLSGPAGSGVLQPNGDPIDPITTLHKIDLTGNADADRFYTGVKVFQDPNTWGWKNGSSPPKDDIQNGLVYFYKDGADNQWVAVAGDRSSTNGTSYIDFEFLQAGLTKNDDGSFTSLGTDGGRTNGDFLLTIELTKGGDQASFFAQIWRYVPAEAQWDYVDTSLSVVDAFVSANIDSVVYSSYPVFGGNSYGVNQFGEAALNLTTVLGLGECFNIETLFIRTKSSASPTAELKDFIEPFKPDFCVDDEPPVITFCPPDAEVECDESVDPADVGVAEGGDNCSELVQVNYSDQQTPGACPQEYTITRSWTATDDCGNTSPPCVQTIHVVDTTPPSISGPGPSTYDCLSDVPDPDISVITASDNCGNVNVTWVSDTPSGECPITIDRVYMAADECENVSFYHQSITVDDKTPPVISCPSNKTFECDEWPTDAGTATATDNCGGDVEITYKDVTAPGSCADAYTITRTWTAEDACGNSDTCDQIITIVDTTPPQISCPSNKSFECDEWPADAGTATATDNCDSEVDVSYSDVSTPGDCPDAFTITRTWRAVDDCGNASTCDQIITIDDTTPPQISCPSDRTFQCDDWPADAGTATATDNCDSEVDISYSDVSTPGNCPDAFTITRTWRAEDDCGNASTCDQIIQIRDTTPPVISCPSDRSFECDEWPADAGTATATDNCDNDVAVSYKDVTSGTCPLTITRTWTATDDCGNSDTCDQIITIDDNTPPVITYCPPDETIECPDVPVFGEPQAEDNCDENPEIIVVSTIVVPGPGPMEATHTRTWIARDECGNDSGECVQVITVNCPTDEFCSFTQGFWGNAGGKFNGQGTPQILQDLLSIGTLTVGKSGRSVSFPSGTGACIIKYLPAGGTPTYLPNGLGDFVFDASCVAPLSLNGEGKFENVLLGQTITLALNVRYDSNLLGFALSSEFCTRPANPGPNGMYGDDDDYPVGTPTHYTIPQSVLDALSNLGLGVNVDGLLELANRALAKQPKGGASYAAINQAVDAINQAFDECAFVASCDALLAAAGAMDEYVYTGPTDRSDLTFNNGPELSGNNDVVAAAPSAPTSFSLEQNYPNPFNPSTRIRMAVPMASNWTLRIFNVKGQLIRSYDGSTGGAQFVDIVWDGRNSVGEAVSTGVYFYRFSAGDYVAVKKMVMIK